MECIILAGGLGTRLRGVIGATPKCMAEVAGKPFLFYLLEYLVAQGVTRVVLSLGYKHELITEHPDLQSFPLDLLYVVEDQPLGTGGGIRLAMSETVAQDVFVVNGDTLFRVDMQSMSKEHVESKAVVTIALKYMQQFDRYGSVALDEHRVITAFHEKQYCVDGFINGGVYLIRKADFLAQTQDGSFSFEQDYLQTQTAGAHLHGFCSEAYFIDIGIPSDFEKAQSDFSAGFSNQEQ